MRRRSTSRRRGKNGQIDRQDSVSLAAELAAEERASELGSLGSKTMDDLRGVALEVGLKNGIPSKRSDLIIELLSVFAEKSGQLLGAGKLDVLNDGYGFLRTQSGSPSDDIYVGQSQVRKFSLRPGDMVAGQIRPPKNGEHQPN